MLWFQYMLYDSVHWQGPITFNLVAFQLFMQYSLMIHNESFNQISPYIVYCLQFVCDKSLLLFASFLVPQLLYKPSNESNPYTIPIFFFMFIILSYSCHGFYSLHSNIEQHTWFTVWNIIFLHYSLGLSLEIENKYRWCSFLSIFIWYYHFESDTQLYYLPKIICLFQFILQKLPLIFDDFTDKDFLSTDQSKQCQMRDQLMRDINNSEAVEKAKIISKLIQANESLYCRYKQADNAKDILLKELLEYSKMNTRHKHEIKKYEKKFDSFQLTSKENMKYKNKWMKSKRKQIKTLTNESSELQLAKQKLIAENECIQKQIKKVNNNSLLYKEEISKMQQTNSSLISTNYKLKKEVKMMNDKLLSFEKEKQKLFQENDECENIFETKFQFWLKDVVKLSQYMFAFKQNKSNDIRVVPFFNKKFIKNEIKILNKMHRRLLLNESAKFKVAQIEFNTIIDSNETLKQYKSVFYNNGILTLKNLQNDITTKKILREMLIDNDDVEKINNLWNCIKHIESELCKMNQNNECVVCMDNNCHCVCIPCGHVALCGICKDLVDERCPICQIRCSIYKLYHS